MPDTAPGMRPLTISERGSSTFYGLIPCAFAQIGLRVVFGLVAQLYDSFWQFINYVMFGTDLLLNRGVDGDLLDPKMVLPYVLGSGTYAVFYFTYGRSLGHITVNAHIVHQRTGRRMRTWQKFARSALQVIINSHPLVWPMLMGVSGLLVLVDRPRRRSLLDLVAGTVVVVGEPAAEEPERARQRSRQPARGQQGAAGGGGQG